MGSSAGCGCGRRRRSRRGSEASGFDPVDVSGALAIELEELPGSEPPAPRLRRVRDPDAELARARREAAEELETARRDRFH